VNQGTLEQTKLFSHDNFSNNDGLGIFLPLTANGPAV